MDPPDPRATAPGVDCTHVREAVSARLDGEDPGLDAALVTAHLDACPDCAHFHARAVALLRRTRLACAWPVPDLTDRIVGAVPGPSATTSPPPSSPPAPGPRTRAPSLRRVRDLRLVVAAAGCVQLVLAVPALLGIAGPDLHVSREIGALQLALGVGLLVAARHPPRARGVLPIAAVVAAAALVTAIVDVGAGVASPAGELVHLAEVVGVLALWRLARRHPTDARGEPEPDRPAARPDDHLAAAR